MSSFVKIEQTDRSFKNTESPQNTLIESEHEDTGIIEKFKRKASQVIDKSQIEQNCR